MELALRARGLSGMAATGGNMSTSGSRCPRHADVPSGIGEALEGEVVWNMPRWGRPAPTPTRKRPPTPAAKGSLPAPQPPYAGGFNASH